MEDSQDVIKLIKVVKFNNNKEYWAEFVLKFKAIAHERGYVGIINGSGRKSNSCRHQRRKNDVKTPEGEQKRVQRLGVGYKRNVSDYCWKCKEQ